MRATPVLLFLAPCVIAANQPTFTYALPANTTVAAMTVDAAGNTYLTGSTTSLDFPATAGALQTQFSGGNCECYAGLHGVPLTIPCADAFVIKLDPAGNVLFATYFGGNGNETVASAICVDASGNIYLSRLHGSEYRQSAGHVPGYALGAAYADFADGVAFVAKLNSSGTALVYSTLLPVNPPALALQQRAVAMAVNPAGEVLHRLHNPGALPFPTTPGAFQSAPLSYPQRFGRGRQTECVRVGAALRDVPVRQWAEQSARDRDRCGTAMPSSPGSPRPPIFRSRREHFKPHSFPSAKYMEFVTKLNPQGTGLGLFHISRRHTNYARK